MLIDAPDALALPVIQPTASIPVEIAAAPASKNHYVFYALTYNYKEFQIIPPFLFLLFQ